MDPEEPASTYLQQIDQSLINKRYGRYLPHWSIENGIYHVRFSLHDALPASVKTSLLLEKEMLLRKIQDPKKEISPTEKKLLMSIYSEKVENSLDSGYGVCWLKQEPIGDLVANALKHFDRERYKLFAWCVMPNHVHVIVQLFQNFELPGIMKSWKGYTAHEANKILKRTGQFWLTENFDRLIRNEEDLNAKINYVLRNPEKAGLRDWKWVGGQCRICLKLE